MTPAWLERCSRTAAWSMSDGTASVPTIRGELRKHFRDHGWMIRPPRRIQELRAAVHAASAELAQTLRRDPTIGELATHLGVEREDVVETLTAMDGYRSASLDAPTSESGTGTLADLMGGPDSSLEQVVDIESVRPLKAGEELTYDYGIVLDVPHTARLKKLWKCLCGAKQCTGTLLKSRG